MPLDEALPTTAQRLASEKLFEVAPQRAAREGRQLADPSAPLRDTHKGCHPYQKTEQPNAEHDATILLPLVERLLRLAHVRAKRPACLRFCAAEFGVDALLSLSPYATRVVAVGAASACVSSMSGPSVASSNASRR